ELGIAEKFPPIATELRVLGFSLFPVLAFFKRRAHRSGWHFVIWSDSTTVEKGKEQKKQTKPRMTRITLIGSLIRAIRVIRGFVRVVRGYYFHACDSPAAGARDRLAPSRIARRSRYR